jgi:hypothetical protein
MVRFILQSFKASMYHSLYREVLARPVALDELGQLPLAIVVSQTSSASAERLFAKQAAEILSKPLSARRAQENAFVTALLRQRNALKERVLLEHPTYQYTDLSRRMAFHRVQAGHRIVEAEAYGTCVLVILRGCARVFSLQQDEGMWLCVGAYARMARLSCACNRDR